MKDEGGRMNDDVVDISILLPGASAFRLLPRASYPSLV